MEDALVLGSWLLEGEVWFGLNPCFNGRCTRTRKEVHNEKSHVVLILVLMEDALVLKSVFSKNGEIRTVLILVLMEDALVRYTTQRIRTKSTCLNPCFNGRCTRT